LSGEAQATTSGRPTGFETAFTSSFIKRSLPSRARRILEVGCGSGELAASLSQDELVVVAIDNDHDSVVAAQRLGVDARLATWPDLNEGQFDAVLFTRSLHHIHPLDTAVERASGVLIAGGRIIVEDFAYEAADEKSLRWFVSAIDALDAAGLLVTGDEFLNAVRAKTETLTAWWENHEPDLHSGAYILAQIMDVFGDVKREEAPYYFRYLARAIVPTADRDKILQELAERETALIAEGAIVALGRRFVATRRIKTK
jgi:SAM-dependent methyltransferase